MSDTYYVSDCGPSGLHIIDLKQLAQRPDIIAAVLKTVSGELFGEELDRRIGHNHKFPEDNDMLYVDITSKGDLAPIPEVKP